MLCVNAHIHTRTQHTPVQRGEECQASGPPRGDRVGHRMVADSSTCSHLSGSLESWGGAEQTQGLSPLKEPSCICFKCFKYFKCIDPHVTSHPTSWEGGIGGRFSCTRKLLHVLFSHPLAQPCAHRGPPQGAVTDPSGRSDPPAAGRALAEEMGAEWGGPPSGLGQVGCARGQGAGKSLCPHGNRP